MYRGRFNPGDEASGERNQPPPKQRRDNALNGMPPEAVRSARIACLRADAFPLAAAIRANPELRDQPLAMVRAPDRVQRRGQPLYYPHSELVEVGALASQTGVRAGMTVAQARALLPELVIGHRSVAAEQSAADALADVAESISPLVEEGTPGQVWVDLTGSEQFYRYTIKATDPAIEESAEGLETAIGEELVRRATRIGLAIAVGIGSSKTLAELAARCGGVRVIAAGQERDFLDWLPLDLIAQGNGGRDDMAAAFKRLGIRRLGELARLDPRAIGSRFGNRGVELARLTRGEGATRLTVRARSETYIESVELDYGIESLEPLGFILRGMLTQLTERLQMRGLAAGGMALSLGLAGHRLDDRRIAVAAPTVEMPALVTLINLSLEKAPPPAAVETIRLTIEPRASRPLQTDMFLPPSPAPDKLEAAIARIAALAGPDRVGTLMPAASYRPEAVMLGTFAPGPAVAPPRPGQATLRRNSVTRLVMRTFRPPEEVEVMCKRETPEFVRGRTICAKVIFAAGPWRYQGEWWAGINGDEGAAAKSADSGWQAAAPNAHARDYYELALADGQVYRAYCDRRTMKWFVDGIYD
ncbi:MAG TPA: DNA polymerase Y family protein [Candidatus Binataceae bacterium]|nr:DNA polymerase Y family protein [Candidatus Binataceae bacterium]